MPEKPKIDPSKLKRDKSGEKEEKPAEKEVKVSAGEIGRVIDLTLNPSRDKMREVTIIDRMQGRMFPLLDMVNLGRRYCIEIASYRQDPKEYKRLFEKERPIIPDLLDELLFRTAQWQKSVAGKNLERAMDMVLAEIETRAEEGQALGGADKFYEEK